METRDDEFLTERVEFARICVEVDLRNVLISKFNLNGRIYKVEYEGLHLICFHCGRYGHRKEGCPLAQPVGGEEVCHENPGDPQMEKETMPEKEKQVAVPAKNPGAKEDPEIFGSWMIAQRKSRKNILHQRRTGDNSAIQVGLNGASHVGAQSHEATVQTRTSGRQLRERACAAGATKEDLREVVGPQSHNVQNVAQTHVNQLRASGSSPQDMSICNARPPDKDQTMMLGDNSVDHMQVCEDTIMGSAEPLLAVQANKPNQNGF
ncbi:Zinc finger, CCHC-type [Sesbania bispinosa]|nr:Zinc finger, CCHC-type [Sesbania bispinosa]